jgi:hypothetical protein
MPVRTLLASATLGLMACIAHATDHPMLPADTPAAYRQKCGSCHAAYPPGMLPARSWQRVMAGLGQHYSATNAALDEDTDRALKAWLQARAGSASNTAEPPQDRITRSTWFAREHDEIDPAVWRLPSVQSAANCVACHAGTEEGDYDDDRLRVPAGLSARQRRPWSWW